MLNVVKRSLSRGSRRSLGMGVGLISLMAAVARPAAAQPPPVGPWLPGLPAPAPPHDDASLAGATAQPGSPGDLSPSQLYERVRRGVVALEKNGVPMAVGTVLAGDGRVLTALSGLGGADGADVHYADGTLVHAKVGRSDKAVDLALLVPQSTAWTDGLSASDMEPLGSSSARDASRPGSHLAPASAGVVPPTRTPGAERPFCACSTST